MVIVFTTTEGGFMYFNSVPEVSLGYCEAVPTPSIESFKACNKKTCSKEDNMYATEKKSDDMIRMSHLTNRLFTSFTRKNWDLRKAFGLVDDDAPESTKDLIERIKNGKYVTRDGWEKPYYLSDNKLHSTCSTLDFIRWRDPATVEDQDGYDAAEKVLSTEYSATKDIIVALPAADGLKALQDFQSKTFH